MAHPITVATGNNSTLFQQYLNEQPVERVNEILLAERAYTASRLVGDSGSTERAYAESFLGFRDSLAGGVDTDGIL